MVFEKTILCSWVKYQSNFKFLYVFCFFLASSTFEFCFQVSYQSDLRLNDGSMVTVIPKAIESETKAGWCDDEMPPSVAFELGDGFGRTMPLVSDGIEEQERKEICVIVEKNVGVGWIGKFGKNVEMLFLLDEGRLLSSSRSGTFWHVYPPNGRTSISSFTIETLPANPNDREVWTFIRTFASRIRDIAQRQPT